MNVLVTGASGFIGSELIGKLVQDRHSLTALSRRNCVSDNGITWIQFDISKDDWTELKLLGVEVVFHLAGQTSVYRAREDPVEDLETNVLGFVRMLEYFRRLQTQPYVILAGTVTQVGIADRLPISPESRDKPITYYDLGKLAAELYLKQYVADGFLRGCIFRLTNVFGHGTQIEETGRSVLDHVFHTALSGKDIEIYGDGEYIRDYIHVSDVVKALQRAIVYADSLNGNTFYLGTGIGTSVKQAFELAVDIAFQITGKKVKINHVPIPSGLSQIEFRNTVVDASQYTNITGWAPEMTIKQGLEVAQRVSRRRIDIRSIFP